MNGWISWIQDAHGGFSVNSQAIALIGNSGCGKTVAIHAIYNAECELINAALRSRVTSCPPCTLPFFCGSIPFTPMSEPRQRTKGFTPDFTNHERFLALTNELSRYRYYDKQGFACFVDNVDLWLPPKGQGRNRAVKFLLRRFPHTQFFFTARKSFKYVALENTFSVRLSEEPPGFVLARWGQER
jgi:predicted ATP-binding protein involved in virulence